MPVLNLDEMAFYAWPSNLDEADLPPMHRRQATFGDTPEEAALQYVLRFQPVAVLKGECCPMLVTLKRAVSDETHRYSVHVKATAVEA